MSILRVGFVQGCPRFGRTAENLERALALSATLDAHLVVIPELWASGYVFSSRAEVDALAEDARRGATALALMAAARRERRHYVAGFPERAGGRCYNSAMLVGPSGVKAVYRKLHLFEQEQRWFTPGDLPLSVHAVGPARVGMMICYDWRFPESARVLTLGGADVIAHPSNLVFPQAQEALRTRALENRVFVVTANRTGADDRPAGRVTFTGRSQVIGPDGDVIARAGVRATCAMAADCDLTLARRKRITAMTPILSNRRPEFYRALVAPIAGRRGTRTARPRARGTARRTGIA
jgi:predicted amidohydrolase